MSFDKEPLTDLKSGGKSRLPELVSWETWICQHTDKMPIIQSVWQKNQKTATILNTNMTWHISACYAAVKVKGSFMWCTAVSLNRRMTSVWHWLAKQVSQVFICCTPSFVTTRFAPYAKHFQWMKKSASELATFYVCLCSWHPDTAICVSREKWKNKTTNAHMHYLSDSLHEVTSSLKGT